MRLFWSVLYLLLLAASESENAHNRNKKQDYYSILGVDSKSDNAAIKKAYRKLAKIHHPDKRQGKDKSKHEAIFREIAEAYEVLSDPVKRQEYDAMQQRSRRQDHYHPPHYQNPHHNGEEEDSYGYHTGGDAYFEYAQSYSFSDIFEDLFSELHNDYTSPPPPAFQPSLTGSYLPAGETIFPYNPIMIADDRSHFFLLDITCSLVVYRGDIEDFLYSLPQDPRQLPYTDLSAFDVIFRSGEHGDLRGNCFAGVDRMGVLQIFSGHPSMTRISPVWKANPPPEDADSFFSSFHRRFFLELSNEGDISVRMLAAGSSEEKCVWSSSSCNQIIAKLKHLRLGFAEIGRQLAVIFEPVLQFLRRLHSSMKDFLVKYDFIGRIDRAMDAAVEAMDAVWNRIFSNDDPTRTEKDIRAGERQRQKRSYNS